MQPGSSPTWKAKGGVGVVKVEYEWRQPGGQSQTQSRSISPALAAALFNSGGEETRDELSVTGLMGKEICWHGNYKKHSRLTQFIPELLWRIKTVGHIRTRTITRSLRFGPSHPHSHNRLEAAVSWYFPHNDACHSGMVPCCGLGVPRDMTDDPQIPMWVNPYLQVQ